MRDDCTDTIYFFYNHCSKLLSSAIFISFGKLFVFPLFTPLQNLKVFTTHLQDTSVCIFVSYCISVEVPVRGRPAELEVLCL